MRLFDIGFNEIDWGPDEATGDDNLVDYFVEIPEYKDILAGKKRYIIGRKGTGKSAILHRIKLESAINPLHFVTKISLKDFPLSYFRDMEDKSFQGKAKYVPAWKFLILVQIAYLLLKDQSIQYSREKEEIERFLKSNFPDNVTMTKTISLLKSKSLKVSMFSSWLSGDVSSSGDREAIADVHFQLAANFLEERIKNISSNSSFYIISDELDEGFQAGNGNQRLIIQSLLRASEDVYLSYKNSGLNIIPIVALRSDIFDNLNDNDLNKFDDYLVRLNWNNDPDSPYYIRKIVDNRIRSALSKKYTETVFDSELSYWDIIANDVSAPRGLWKYICMLTFSRPRDIIKFLKYCQKRSFQTLSFDIVKANEFDYSNWFHNEFRDEVQSFLPCWKEVLNSLTEIARGKEEIATLQKTLDAKPEIRKWLSENSKTSLDIIKILFTYSVIGCINEHGRWIFKYKDDYFDFFQSYKYYVIHYGFCKKLRILKGYERTYLNVVYYERNVV